ncbi:serine hydrolase domain-containing protein [Flavihumibacter stibioxidans]|nr:serine hydrolase domain-containing protein [Flavihumibacter stibioxidans]
MGPKNLLTALFVLQCTLNNSLTVLSQQHPDDDYLKRGIDSFIVHKMETFQIPGASVAILKHGQIIYTNGYGFANLELRVPAKPETSYLIGSVTKTFTAAAAMILWEEGRFNLDDIIGDYLPHLPHHWKPVTIRQLLHHTSGIVTNLGKADSLCKFNFDCDNYTRANVIQETACLPLSFEPGTKWEYSGRGYYVLGMLIEKLSGKTFSEFLKERIFTPLGMSETGMINYDIIVPNRASGYVVGEYGLQNSPQMNPEVELSDGGLISTALDLAKWDASFYTERILKRSTIDLMWSNARLKDNTIVSSYGIGFGLTPYKGHKRVGHTGDIPGFSSCITRFTNQNITVIILTNITNSRLNIGKLGNEIAACYWARKI